jgi:hypothetical protein
MTGATKVAITADLELGNTDWELVAEARSGSKLNFTLEPKTAVQLQDVANALYRRFANEDALFDTPTFPAIGLKYLSLSYEDGASASVPSLMKFETVLQLGQPSDKPLIEKLGFLFAKIDPKPNAGQSHYLAGIRSEGSISLVSKNAGVIGQLLGDVALEKLGLYYASQNIDAFRFADTDKARDVPSGLSVSLSLKLSESYVDISLSSAGLVLSPSGSAAAPALLPKPPEPTPAGGPPSPPPQPVKPAETKQKGVPRVWKDLNTTLGPLQLRRIGGEWIAEEGRVGILLDAAISLAGLTVALSGLSVNVKPQDLTNLSFDKLGFKLDGMALDFQRAPISISGMLLKGGTPPNESYSGKALIRAATFSIGAIGAYGKTPTGESSFFIFGAFTGMLGGPPCFVVQGIAAGFGYNRAIVLPEIDKVRDFPLVALVLPPKPQSPVTKGADIVKIDNYDDMFPPTAGQYWIAAGVYFSSFKLIETFALATVQFGARLEIALLGVATVQQPPKEAAGTVPPLIVVEMAIKARFAPDDGLLSVMAVLTANSFLFDTRCKLTGGFAFCVWFPPTNPNIENHAGDFVLTLGGYHPKFKVPAHYPKVPRIGFDWQLPECGVSITGEAYFALTPSFIMAGARLAAVFRAGDFSAWFVAYADFLIGWAPLQYEAEMGVRIGAAFVLRIGDISCRLSFEIGAQLHIWGPPFAGEARVDLGIVAFTVPIGDRSASREPQTLEWEEFNKTFLPSDPLRITITSGVVQEHKGDGKADQGFIIVNPSELCLSVESFVPVPDGLTGRQAYAEAPIARYSASSGDNPMLGIRPMGVTKFGSSLTLEWPQTPDPGSSPKLACRDIIKNLPEALWSPSPKPDARTATELEAKAISNVLMGVEVMPRECEQFPADATVHEIKTREENVPARHWQPTRKEQEKSDEPGNLRRPDREVIEAIRAAGFSDILENAVDVERLFEAGDPTSVWLAALTFVQIGNLPPPSAGA